MDDHCDYNIVVSKSKTSNFGRFSISDRLTAVRIEGIKGEVTIMPKVGCFPYYVTVVLRGRKQQDMMSTRIIVYHTVTEQTMIINATADL